MAQPWSEDEIIALIVLILVHALELIAAFHAIMKKRDPRSSAAWCALILLAPIVGTLLYWLFGINRIERKAKKIYGHEELFNLPPKSSQKKPQGHGLSPSFNALSDLTGKLTEFPLRPDNSVEELLNGESAYPKMLHSIQSAKESVLLSTFIFDDDPAGRQFAKALRQAGERGVKVRVLVDDIGARYSFPSIVRKLKGEGVKVKRFHRVIFPWLFNYSQLRSHRKLLIVDSNIGYIGGMNIREGHLLHKAKAGKKTQDVHFSIYGPILIDLYNVFKKDWAYAGKGELDVQKITAEQFQKTYLEKPNDRVIARVIPNQPRENFGEHRWTIIGALSIAKEEVLISTPYFLPDQELLSSLGAAALRGVSIKIYLPQKNNHNLAHWACMANLWQVIETGCQVFLTPPPFDHSKIMLVDKFWSFIGSTNWDARSLRLNFELNIECYNANLAWRLKKVLDAKAAHGAKITKTALNERPWGIKLRDSLARLLTPYL